MFWTTRLRSAPDALAIHKWHRRSSISDPLLAAQPYAIHIAYGYADRVANTDSFTYGYADADAHEYQNTHADSHDYAHEYGDAYFDSHAYPDTPR
jgi:hypothetical protein